MIYKLILYCFITFALTTTMYANTMILAQQSTEQESEQSSKTEVTPTQQSDSDSVKMEETTSADDLPKNPFDMGQSESEQLSSEENSNDEKPSDTEEESEPVSNPFLAAPEPEKSEDDEYESSLPFDLLADINIGFNFSKLFDIRPLDITAQGQGDYTFNMSLLFLMQSNLYGKAGIRTMRNRFETSLLQLTTNGDTALTTSKETFNFLTLPLNIGMRFSILNVVPYIQVNVEPGYLTFSSRTTYRRIVTMFGKKTKLISINTADQATTDVQSSYQLFGGISGGIEKSYGYGAVYLETGLMYMAIEPSTEMTSPIRTQSKLFYIPITLGMRFYI